MGCYWYGPHNQVCFCITSAQPNHSTHNKITRNKFVTNSKTVLKVLQWNMNGFLNNNSFLGIIISQHKPHVIFLQERHMLTDNECSTDFKNYKCYFHNQPYLTHRSGVGVLILKANSHEVFHINCPILAIGVKIRLNPAVSVVSTYLEHSLTVNHDMLVDFSNQLPSNTVVGGDFFAHHSLWGNTDLNSHGVTIENWISDNNYVLLNDGSPTLLSTRGSLTAVDLTLTTPSLAHRFSWCCLDQQYGNDHFPKLLSSNVTMVVSKFTPCFVELKADWSLFVNQITNLDESFHPSTDINKETAHITKILCTAAKRSMLKTTSHFSLQPCSMNIEIARLIQQKNHSWLVYSRQTSASSLLALRKLNAVLRRKIRQVKKQSWINFSSSLNEQVSTKEVWNKVKLLYGNKSAKSIKSHLVKNQAITDSTAMAEALAAHWSSYANDSNFSSDFIRNKLQFHIPPTNSHPSHNLSYPVSFSDFNNTLNSLKGATPGKTA